MASADGLRLMVRVTPRSGRDAIEGMRLEADGRAYLAVKVSAMPSDGAANEAVTRTVARALDVAPRKVAIVSGDTSRVKQLRVEGDAAALATRLQALIKEKPA